MVTTVKFARQLDCKIYPKTEMTDFTIAINCGVLTCDLQGEH